MSIHIRKISKGQHKCKTWINWQDKVYKTKKNKTKTQYNMCWVQLYTTKHK